MTHHTTLEELAGIGPVKVIEETGDGNEVAIPYVYFLTPCCEATAKGVEYGTGIACRACGAELPAAFGGAPPPDKLDAYLAIYGGK